jgi:hypothetical protein
MAAKDTPSFDTPQTNEELAKRLADVETQLAAARAAAPLTLIPEHGAGPGMKVSETWSQTEQEQANRQQDIGTVPKPV